VEKPWWFWPRFVWQTVHTHAVLAGTLGRLHLQKMVIVRGGNAGGYTDRALTSVDTDGDEDLDLLTMTTGAANAIAHAKRIAALTTHRSRPGAGASKEIVATPRSTGRGAA
jgi:hypothetical protein